MSLSPKILGLLKDVPLFSGLSDEILIQHLSHINQISIPAGRTLLAPDDVNEYIYVILSGRLQVNPDKSGSDPIAMFGEGESVGEMSILNGNKALDYLSANTDCELLCIDPVSIWSLVKNSHRAALNMLNILSAPIPMSKRTNHNLEQQHGYAGLDHVDELTGLYNTQWMFQIFERQIRRLSITHDHAILMLVSIDRLDQYSQSHGMLGEDQAFRTIAQSILTCLRPDDLSGRYLDKTIAIFMSRTTLKEGRIAGLRLQSQVSQAEIVTPNGDALPHITISIGIAEVREKSTMQELFDQAGEALKRANEAGGNCVNS